MTANDTTTTLNPGVGGDVMDESLITQAGTGAGTVAKRQRVVIAGDAQGAAVVDPVAADPGANPFSVPALGVGVVNDPAPGGYKPGELRPVAMTPDGSIRVTIDPPLPVPDFGASVAPCFDATPGAWSSEAFNPWGRS